MNRSNNGAKLDEPRTGGIPWPSDAVMIVASLAGTEIREHMEDVLRCWCRRCGELLHADTAVYRRAMTMPERMGRPVMFFCVECCVLHDVRPIEIIEDRRGPK